MFAYQAANAGTSLALKSIVACGSTCVKKTPLQLILLIPAQSLMHVMQVWHHHAHLHGMLEHLLLYSKSCLQKGAHSLIFSCIADDVRQGFNVHFAETYEDVYKVALDYEVDSL